MSERGLTLVEALLAVLLAAALAAGLGRSSVAAVEGSRITSDREAAAALASRSLEEMLATEPVPRFEEDHVGDLARTRRVREVAPGLFLVEASVATRRGVSARRATLRFVAAEIVEAGS